MSKQTNADAPVYNNEQRIFALNFMSNLANLKPGTAAYLQKQLDETLHGLMAKPEFISLMGKWQIVWGPVVTEDGADAKTKFATNAMYVARNEDASQYVIAIAGTNAFSWYGWTVEDFKTYEMVNWFSDDKSTKNDTARIALGTHIGLQALLSMKWAPSADKKKLISWRNKQSDAPDTITLMQFLENEFGAENYHDKTQLVVTGHSLGGTLCSVMAMRLFEWQTNVINAYDSGQKPWNPSHSVTLTAMPVANATPGNKLFSEYFGNKMGTRTLRVWNRFDPVPYGHQPDMIQALPHLYYPWIVPDLGVYTAVDAMLASSYAGTGLIAGKGGHYTQIIPQCGSLPGQFNSQFASAPPGTAMKMVTDYMAFRILTAYGISEEQAKKIIAVINEVLKIMNWISETSLLEKMHLSLGATVTDQKLLGKIMNAFSLAMGQMTQVLTFLQQLGYQHVWAYFDLLDMKQIIPIIRAAAHGAADDDLTVSLKANEEGLRRHWERMLTPEFMKKHY